MKSITFVLFYILLLSESYGQSGITSGGQESNSVDYSFTHVIGEVTNGLESGGRYAVKNGIIQPTKKVGTFISDVEMDESILVSPNPAQNQLKVKVSSNESIQYTILDVSGKYILSSKLDEEIIDVSHLLEGTYIIKLQSETFMASELFVKL